MEGTRRTYIDKRNLKVFAIKDSDHRELEFNMNLLDKYRLELGWHVYAINDEGIFFYLANCDLDGKNWCKITKVLVDRDPQT